MTGLAEHGTADIGGEVRAAAALAAALVQETDALSCGAVAAVTAAVLEHGSHPLSRGAAAAVLAASIALERVELPIAVAVAAAAAERPVGAEPAGLPAEISFWSRAAMAREAPGPVPWLRRY